MTKKLFTAFIFMIAVCSCSRTAEIYDAKCEGLNSPLGIDTSTPCFSWKIRSQKENFTQQSYEIEVASSEKLLKRGKADLWKSGCIPSSRQIMVPYEGSALHSRQICYWRVRINEESEWSPVQRFSVGILDQMKGKYIGACPGRSALLRKKFCLQETGETALLYVNSLGYHLAYINGVPVSDAVLQPAVSQLDKRSLIVTYDISDLLGKGENEIVLWTSTGWYKPGSFGAIYDGALVRAEIDIDTTTVLVTDGSWSGCYSGYSDTGKYQGGDFGGERIEAAFVPASMAHDEMESREWIPVDTVDIAGITAVQQMCEPCRTQEIFCADTIMPYKDSCLLVDFSRTVNGQFEIAVPAHPEGTVIKASFADWKNEDGGLRIVGTDSLICSGNPAGDIFKEKFNHHVFRYVLLEGLTETPSTELIKAYRMRTDYRRTGTFKCSDKDMNDIEKMISYTMENLAFNGYMVDCATLERLGYGGDGNASTLSLQTIFGVGPLYRNWLTAWRDVIRDDGGLPHTAPCPWRAGGGPYWCTFIVQAPWRTFMSYDDDRPMKECYPYMKQWLGYVDNWSQDGLLRRWPDTDYRGWYLGDWIAPKGIDVTDPKSIDLIGNCSLVQCYNDLEKIAEHLGESSDADMFRQRRSALVQSICKEFFNPKDSTFATGTQLDMSYTLLTGTVPQEYRQAVEKKLIDRCTTIDSGYLKAGLVGVPVMTEWATLSGNDSIIYSMLKKREYPGYLYMIDNGADATWEDWAITARSHMHNCFNGIGSWFYQGLGGIIPKEPGYSRVSINPSLPGEIKWVYVSEETPYGVLSVYADTAAMTVNIPVGITAEINGSEYGNGTYTIIRSSL